MRKGAPATDWLGVEFPNGTRVEGREGSMTVGVALYPRWACRCGCGIKFYRSSQALLESRKKASRPACDKCNMERRRERFNARREGRR